MKIILEETEEHLKGKRRVEIVWDRDDLDIYEFREKLLEPAMLAWTYHPDTISELFGDYSEEVKQNKNKGEYMKRASVEVLNEGEMVLGSHTAGNFFVREFEDDIEVGGVFYDSLSEAVKHITEYAQPPKTYSETCDMLDDPEQNHPDNLK